MKDSTMHLTRRRCLVALGATALPTLGQAQAEPPALQRPLAARSACLDLTRAGERLVAVGERGHVLLSDDQGKTWRQAKAVPTRTTLTAVHATDARTLWAVGHGGTILRSGDAGDTWTRVQGRIDGTDTLLAVRVEPDGHGLAVGGFGFALRTQDGGAKWERAELLPGEAGERHLNRIFVSARSTWLIAAENGAVLRSEDRGAHWQLVATPYKGSLWSGQALADGVMLACGMRGNLVRSSDDGRSWKHQAIPGAGSLTAIALRADQRPVVVGVDGSLLSGNLAGDQFTFKRLDDRTTLTGALVLSSGELLVAGTAGLRTLPLPA